MNNSVDTGSGFHLVLEGSESQDGLIPLHMIQDVDPTLSQQSLMDRVSDILTVPTFSEVDQILAQLNQGPDLPVPSPLAEEKEQAVTESNQVEAPSDEKPKNFKIIFLRGTVQIVQPSRQPIRILLNSSVPSNQSPNKTLRIIKGSRKAAPKGSAKKTVAPKSRDGGSSKCGKKNNCPISEIHLLTTPKPVNVSQNVAAYKIDGVAYKASYKCELCPAKFPSKTGFELHMRKHRSAGDSSSKPSSFNKPKALTGQYASAKPEASSKPDVSTEAKASKSDNLPKMGIPLIDLNQANVLSELAAIGFKTIIPLAASAGTYAVPIIEVAPNKKTYNMGGIKVSNVLALGPQEKINVNDDK